MGAVAQCRETLWLLAVRLGALVFGFTWRFANAWERESWGFVGSYKWGFKSPNMGHKYGYPTYNPLITTHEPPSRVYSKGAEMIANTILGVALIVVLV